MLTPALQSLARSIQETCSPRISAPPLPTWPALDQAIRGLPKAAIHEWFNADSALSTQHSAPRIPWLPSLTPILHLARNTTDTIVWIGRRVWPYPVSCPDLLSRSIFIDAKDLAERAWATDVSLRCPGLTVIADGSAFTMSISRRLQLAAGEGAGIGLILRPHSDLNILSAAHTRWLITPLRSTSTPQWQLQLLRCKSTKLPHVTTWTLALHETGALHLVPHAPDRSVQAQEISGAVNA